ncbi:MAG: extracellular solute-binding protein [Gammaproteobacteria bacterium]
MTIRTVVLLRSILGLALCTLYGCGADDSSGDGVVRIEVWAHAGQEAERRVLKEQVGRFNANRSEVEARLTLIPEGSYNAQLQAAAAAGDLPDIFELDGPYLALFAWQGRLRILDRLLPPGLVADLLPSVKAQGMYRGRLWAVGAYDSGLCLYADRSGLERAGIRIPALERPWLLDEFQEILGHLARSDPDGRVLDLKLNYAGEWYTYAFSPLLRSAGGGLASAESGAGGILNGPASVAAMAAVQGWILQGLVDPNIDDAAFASGRVALAFGGHWNYARYREKLRNRLLLLPLPDFGKGPKTGQGSWLWAVAAESRNTAAAARFLTFLLSPPEILAMTSANGAVPSTRTAAALSPDYRPGGPLHLFVRQLEGGYAVPRPNTPAYPVITAEFQKAFDRIRSGADVASALDRAAEAVDNEIEDNRGYPLVGRARGEILR